MVLAAHNSDPNSALQAELPPSQVGRWDQIKPKNGVGKMVESLVPRWMQRGCAYALDLYGPGGLMDIPVVDTFMQSLVCNVFAMHSTSHITFRAMILYSIRATGPAFCPYGFG